MSLKLHVRRFKTFFEMHNTQNTQSPQNVFIAIILRFKVAL